MLSQQSSERCFWYFVPSSCWCVQIQGKKTLNTICGCLLTCLCLYFVIRFQIFGQNRFAQILKCAQNLKTYPKNLQGPSEKGLSGIEGEIISRKFDHLIEKDFKLCNMELKTNLIKQKLKPPKTKNNAKSPVCLGPVHESIFLASCCLHTSSASVHICQSAELPEVQLLTYTSRCVFHLHTSASNLKHLWETFSFSNCTLQDFYFYRWFLVQNFVVVVQLEQSCVRWPFELWV